ncbi:MAG: hypothetical protein COU28_02980 [Candidatus Magasanikbacteria bacterium CG10_big_fil_rev_8_21_14_0_10_36_16]|uniref:Uncharacterized protein n=1 Tax=Candidatus Magasanikbacteria bacterium CG10_big_fil_rev_8_21_14_0_10_36_16 TaxID=1974645 RepID=A0A2H0TY73_9BACT|nr:MAG: hypothetical protein COU28_02980 [Candidatus Magasanikbacteria bacterium CG10_big_fil_rev_8_21_14_0_10_36_16]
MSIDIVSNSEIERMLASAKLEAINTLQGYGQTSIRMGNDQEESALINSFMDKIRLATKVEEINKIIIDVRKILESKNDV